MTICRGENGGKTLWLQREFRLWKHCGGRVKSPQYREISTCIMPLLEMRNIVKEFPGVRALDGVSLAVEEGQFHALVGENGAGKSTLIKILAGVYPAGSYSGEILVGGAPTRFSGIADSERAGVAVIHQELSLVKELTAAENIFLGREPAWLGVIDRHRLYDMTRRLLNELHVDINPNAKAGSLGIGKQQLVEIAKALSQDAKILVLDEPTAALAESEVEALFEILEKLKARGVGIIYISHKLDEVFRMSDRITVLRDGRTIGTHNREEVRRNGLIAEMVGREVDEIFPEIRHSMGEVALKADGITAVTNEKSVRPAVEDVSFEVRRGEVVGIAGLMGSGRTELLMALFGAFGGRVTGRIMVEGREAKIGSPADAIRYGIGFVTEDRKRYGLLLDQSVTENLSLASLKQISGRWMLHPAKEAAAAAVPTAKLRIKAPSPATVTGTLSGGNQQKVVLGKWLLTRPKILFLDEPTRGIDVGAKQEIYREINALAKDGLAIVLVSSELPEIIGLSDRVMVLHKGRKSGEFTREEASPEKIMAAATGTL
jgi:D-xylose transport system ATP-binding protein